jgi:hypothetical protein
VTGCNAALGILRKARDASLAFFVGAHPGSGGGADDDTMSSRPASSLHIGVQVAKVKSARNNHSPVSSYRTLLLISCGVAFACYFGSYMRIPVVPLFARSLGATTGEVGMINSAFLLVAGLLSLPLGILSDRIGRKLLVAGGLLISAGTSPCFISPPPAAMVALPVFRDWFGGICRRWMFVADFLTTHLGRPMDGIPRRFMNELSRRPGWVATPGFRRCS